MGVAFDRYTWGSGKSEIGNFKNVIFGDEQVLGFEIPMEYFFFMAVVNSLEKLVAEALRYQSESTLTIMGSIPVYLLKFPIYFLRS